MTGALEFSDQVAGDVAVPLDQLVTVQVGATPEDVERLVAKRGFSRFPFADADGELTGYLHLKDILYADDERQRQQPVPLKRVRRLATVGAGDEVEDVLATMQRTGLAPGPGRRRRRRRDRGRVPRGRAGGAGR